MLIPAIFLLWNAGIQANAASAFSPPAPPAELARVADSVYWHRLLHYKLKLLRAPRSGITGAEFFLAPDGSRDPARELEATLRAFADPSVLVGGLRQPAQCAFPERFRFLREELHLTTPILPCRDFREWKEGLHAKSVTVIYSSAYPNSPGSMFGHNLVRLNAQDDPSTKGRLDLLSYGVGYAAAVSEKENPFKYALWGLFGGYDGFYSAEPFYMKVNEYSNAESRDLWEYDISFTPDQVDHFVNHLWELMATARFTYYFADENCAYQLLTALEAVNPGWQLSEHFGGYVLPADTIKRLVQQGAVAGVRLRPSIQKQMQAKIDSLTPAERADFSDLLAGRKKESEVANPNTLEALAGYLEYLKFRDNGLAGERAAQFRRVLVRRSQIAAQPEARTLTIDESSRPDLGHESSSADLGYGYRRDFGHLTTIGARWGLHGLMDEDLGYAHFSQIEFLGTHLDYVWRQHQLQVRDISIAEATSLYRYSSLDPRVSWRAAARVDNFRDIGCYYCHGLIADGGAGISLPYQSGKGILYALALADIEAGKALPHRVRGGPAATLSTIWNPTLPYKVSLSSKVLWDLWHNYAHSLRAEFGFDQSYQFSPSWAAQLASSYLTSSQGVADNYQFGLTARYYY